MIILFQCLFHSHLFHRECVLILTASNSQNDEVSTKALGISRSALSLKAPLASAH